MLHCWLDHIVITAPSLAEGVDYVRQALGVTPQKGGEHSGMGTHNCLLRLGEATYLEVIAVNPNTPPPDHPRVFALDHVEATPRLATWVARTNDLQAAAVASPLPLGNIEQMSRGQWNWRITIPADGSMPAQGIAPTLMQWLNEPHPASTLQDMGCSLVRLEGFHPDAERIAEMLKSVGFEGAFSVSPLSPQERPYLVATIQTPDGVRKLMPREAN